MSYYQEIDSDIAPTLAKIFETCDISGFDSAYMVLEDVVERLLKLGIVKEVMIRDLVKDIKIEIEMDCAE